MARAKQPFLSEVRLKREDVPSFDQYPFSLNAVRDLETLRLNSGVTIFVGENGSGKSTLLEAIAVKWGFNPEGGSRNFRFETRSSHSELHEYLILARCSPRPKTDYFLRAESFFNVATEIENLDKSGGIGAPVIGSYGGNSLHEQSHGESFLSLVMNRFGASGFYILDEPEAALSPSRLLVLLVRLNELVKGGSQFIIATHSPILMAFPGATLYSLGECGVEEVEYRATEHWRLIERFVRDPESVLRMLLEEDGEQE